MSVTKYTRGIPTYTDADGATVGMLCETKERCITDDNGVSLESKLQQFIDGTLQVGDAGKLDGKGADEFAKADDVRNNTDWNEFTSGFDLNNALGKCRALNGQLVASLLNLPPSNFITSSNNTSEIMIEWLPQHSSNSWGIQRAIVSKNGIHEIWYRSVANTTWKTWEKDATTADLSNYLPLTGGVTVKNPNRRVISVSNTGGADVSIGYRHGDTLLGEIGVKDSGAYFIDSNNKLSTILHTGNKPTGTYTGNGSTVKRTIATGGIGDAIVVKGNNGTCAFIYKGAIGREGTTVKSFTASEADVNESILYLITNDACLNAEGVVYTYHVV